MMVGVARFELTTFPVLPGRSKILATDITFEFEIGRDGEIRTHDLPGPTGTL